MEYAAVATESGKVGVETRLTPRPALLLHRRRGRELLHRADPLPRAASGHRASAHAGAD
ncbi:MAG: hypothetical protein M0C28_24745 [Candidatus Moduliflexus flocculans]|nr:hypothetical protein [Candidatus Moduliflexus flocculans]